MSDHDLALLQPRQRRLMLVYVNDISGQSDAMTAKAALKRHPDLFQALFEEMRQALAKAEAKKVKQGRLWE